MEIESKHAALNLFEMLGIKDVSSKTQVKNGTTVYELPIKDMNARGNQYAIRYAIYESGMVRNVSPCNSSCWQINKRYEVKKKWWNSTYKKYYTHSSYERILIDNSEDRLVYLANYIMRNNYRKGQLSNVCEWAKECITENHETLHSLDNVVISREEFNRLKGNFKNLDEIQVIVNGHRYNLS
tara:strand:- start:1824 stop:2372 length:549 start_codon:yes stop_codon:yes gene_type:complete